MNDRMFVVDTSDRYRIKIEEIKNIEDCPDDFCTFDEVCELLGRDPSTSGSYVPSETINRSLVESDLTVWKRKMIDENKKSLICTDALLIEFLKECGWEVSYFCSGLRRIGSRLYLKSDHANSDFDRKG